MAHIYQIRIDFEIKSEKTIEELMIAFKKEIKEQSAGSLINAMASPAAKLIVRGRLKPLHTPGTFKT